MGSGLRLKIFISWMTVASMLKSMPCCEPNTVIAYYPWRHDTPMQMLYMCVGLHTDGGHGDTVLCTPGTGQIHRPPLLFHSPNSMVHSVWSWLFEASAISPPRAWDPARKNTMLTASAAICRPKKQLMRGASSRVFSMQRFACLRSYHDHNVEC